MYAAEIPYGYVGLSQTLARKLLGPEYFLYNVSARRYETNHKAEWFYQDRTIWFKDAKNQSIITMAMLTKKKA